jgi:hypothetical protein
MYVDGMLQCYTLEPPVPVIAGVYPISLYNSPKFGYHVPLLNNVPNHTFVEIHPGNTAKDTKLCILVGATKMHDEILNSKIAFDILLQKIKNAIDSGEKVNVSVEPLVSAPEV